MPKSVAQRMSEYYARLKTRMTSDPELRLKIQRRAKAASKRYYDNVKNTPLKLAKLRARVLEHRNKRAVNRAADQLESG